MNMLPDPRSADHLAARARAEEVRKDPALIGEAAYEAHRQLLPLYHDGTPRPVWDELDALCQWSWNRPGCPS